MKRNPGEHPDDYAIRVKATAYGRKYAAEFVAAHLLRMEKLIGTYADADAEEQLAHLRERFWAELWKPKALRRKR